VDRRLEAGDQSLVGVHQLVGDRGDLAGVTQHAGNEAAGQLMALIWCANTASPGPRFVVATITLTVLAWACWLTQRAANHTATPATIKDSAIMSKARVFFIGCS
jgi:hypothetical protein